jgi:hypothetical protein
LTLEFNRLTYDGIRELAANPCPECELEKMSSFELELLDERIDKIAYAVNSFKNQKILEKFPTSVL